MKFLSVLKKLVPSMIRTEVRGLHNIPAEGPVLLVGDHPNILDGLLLAAVCPRPVRILVAGELCSSPLVERIVRNLGWLPVERHQAGRNSDTLKECVEALQNGEVLAIFPEGKTNYGRELLPFKPGAALLARRSGAPVVTFSVRGTEELYPDGSRVFHSGRAALSFGEPETFTNEMDVETVTGLMKERILELQRPLRDLPLGRLRRPFEFTGLTGAAVLKALSLTLLTVRWR